MLIPGFMPLHSQATPRQAELSPFHRGGKQDAQLLSDRATGQTQALLAPKRMPEYRALLLLEAWRGRDSCARWRRGSPPRPPEMSGRKGSGWLDAQQRQVPHAWGQEGPAREQGLSALAPPIPGSIPKTGCGCRNHLLPSDQVPRLQTDLSIRTQKAGTGWSPNRCQVQNSSKENRRETMTNGGFSRKASKQQEENKARWARPP